MNWLFTKKIEGKTIDFEGISKKYQQIVDVGNVLHLLITQCKTYLIYQEYLLDIPEIFAW